MTGLEQGMGLVLESDLPLHPDYVASQEERFKYRKVLESGQCFINQYIQQYSSREAVDEYRLRMLLTYNPAFALAALNDIKNSIVQRMPDIVRTDGSDAYLSAMKGEEGGVTRRGHDMNGYLAEEVILEMLGMEVAGIYIDAPKAEPGETIEEAAGKRPYFYTYVAEEILNWVWNEEGGYEKLLLSHWDFEYDTVLGLPKKKIQTFRFFFKDEVSGKVFVAFFKDKDQLKKNEPSAIVSLDISEIPFVTFKLPYSLLKDTANYQIALLNLCSSDLLYAYKGNFSFYIEQYDRNEEENYRRTAQFPNASLDAALLPDGTVTDPQYIPTPATSQTDQVTIGPMRGRKYPIGTEAPSFINPSTEPLIASLGLRKELKDEIRLLTNLSVAGLSPKTSANQSNDQDSVEAGISFIAGILQAGERQIAKIWSLYESGSQVGNIVYPTTYSIKTIEERLASAKELSARIDETPSVAARKQLAKKALSLLFNTESPETIKAMNDEIDKCDNIVISPQTLQADIEAALVGNKMGSMIRGYPEGEYLIAAKDHAERLARIQAAQTSPNATMGSSSRDGSVTGIPDMKGDPNAAKNEKSISQAADRHIDGKAVRGKGKTNAK